MGVLLSKISRRAASEVNSEPSHPDPSEQLAHAASKITSIRPDVDTKRESAKEIAKKFWASVQVPLSERMIGELEGLARRYADSNVEDAQIKELALDLIDKVIHGYGPLEQLFADDKVVEIYIDSFANVKVMRERKILDAPTSFSCREELKYFAECLALRCGISPTQPGDVFKFVLPDELKTRVLLVRSGLTDGDASRISFYLPRVHPTSMFDLLHKKTLPATVAAWLSELVSSGAANIVVCGPSRSGKSLLLGALISSIGSDQRILVFENMPEVGFVHPHALRVSPTGPVNRAQFQEELKEIIRVSKNNRVVFGDLDPLWATLFSQSLDSSLTGNLASVRSKNIQDCLISLSAWLGESDQKLSRLSKIDLIVSLEEEQGIPCLSELAEVSLKDNDVYLQTLIKFEGREEGKRIWSLESTDSWVCEMMRKRGLVLSAGPALRRRREPEVQDLEGSL
jgi:pilus assembly protein CpaF